MILFALTYGTANTLAAGSCPDDGSIPIPTTPAAGYTPLSPSCEVGNTLVGQWVLISDNMCGLQGPGTFIGFSSGHVFEKIEGYKKQIQRVWGSGCILASCADAQSWCASGPKECSECLVPEGYLGGWPCVDCDHNPTVVQAVHNEELSYYEWECF